MKVLYEQGFSCSTFTFVNSDYCNTLLFIMKNTFSEKILLSVGTLPVAMFSFIGKVVRRKHNKYTIGRTIGCTHHEEGGIWTHFEFDVKGKKYISSSTDAVFSHKQEGAFFLVRYFPQNPHFCNILFRYPVEALEVNIPFDGWDEIPAEIKKR